MDLLLRCLRSGVWADPTVIGSAPVAPIVVVAAKEARPGVVAEMVEMSAIKTMAAGHATNVTTQATDVTSAEAAAQTTDVAFAEAAAHATDVASAEAATAQATAMTAAAPAAHQR